MAERHADWALGFADETWWSRFARPHLHTWTDPADGPLRLIEQDAPKSDPDPKAVACYGVLLRQRGGAERVWVRFVDGRPVSAITEQFLGWCCDHLQLAGVRVWVLIWDNASWHDVAGEFARVRRTRRGWCGRRSSPVGWSGVGYRPTVLTPGGPDVVTPCR